MKNQSKETLLKLKAQSVAIYKAKEIRLNSKLSEMIQTLTGLTSVTIVLNSESATVKSHYGLDYKNEDYWRTNDIDITIRKPYNFKKSKYDKKETIELGWFSSRASNNGSCNYYFDYLNILGVVANDIKNDGPLSTEISKALKTLRTLNSKTSKIYYEIESIDQDAKSILINLKKQDVKRSLASTDLIELKQNTYSLRRRHNIKVDGLTITKYNKKTTEVDLRTVYNSYKLDKDGQYIKDEDGNYVMEITHSTYSKRFKNEDLIDYVNYYWPKEVESYQTKTAA